MLEQFFFSIAGFAANSAEIRGFLDRLVSSPVIPKKDKVHLKYTQEVGLKGAYPSSDYYARYYQDYGVRTTSMQELSVLVDQIIDFYERADLQRKVTEAINNSHSTSELRRSLAEVAVVEADVSDMDVTQFAGQSYGDQMETPSTAGIKTGVSYWDDLTNGFQRRSVATIAAFTGHGKSITWISIIYRNAREGKKCVYASLELAPSLVSLMLQCRWLYEAKGVKTSTQDMMARTLPKMYQDKLAKGSEWDLEFKRDVLSNVLITDSSILTKRTATDSNAICALYSAFAKALGGLDLVVYDHVNQLENLFPEMGNQIIKVLTDAGVRWTDAATGLGTVTGFAAQCNRKGWEYAQRHGGDYAVTAISDLNEIERASSYVCFVFSDPDMIMNQEIVISMKKHRFGKVPITLDRTIFLPANIMVGENVAAAEVSGTDAFANFDTTSIVGGVDDSVTGEFQATDIL